MKLSKKVTALAALLVLNVLLVFLLTPLGFESRPSTDLKTVGYIAIGTIFAGLILDLASIALLFRRARLASRLAIVGSILFFFPILGDQTGSFFTHWAATHAARRDLRFEWEPEGEPYLALKQAMERLRATDEGAPVWALGDGLAVVDGFRDELLAMDPDEREAILKALREVGHSFFGDGEPERPASPGPQPTDCRRGRRSRAASA